MYVSVILHMVRITYELFFFDQNFSFLDNFCAIPLIVSSINKLIEIVQIVVVDNLHFESFHKKLTKMTDIITNQVKRGTLSEIDGRERKRTVIKIWILVIFTNYTIIKKISSAAMWPLRSDQWKSSLVSETFGIGFQEARSCSTGDWANKKDWKDSKNSNINNQSDWLERKSRTTNQKEPKEKVFWRRTR